MNWQPFGSFTADLLPSFDKETSDRFSEIWPQNGARGSWSREVVEELPLRVTAMQKVPVDCSDMIPEVAMHEVEIKDLDTDSPPPDEDHGDDNDHEGLLSDEEDGDENDDQDGNQGRLDAGDRGRGSVIDDTVSAMDQILDSDSHMRDEPDVSDDDL